MGRGEKNNDYICRFDNMQNMKRALSAIIISAAMFAACSEEPATMPGISFITPEPEILEETAIFRIIGQPFSSADSVIVPVVFGGTAEMGVDYDVSADHFVFNKESLMDSIVISTRQLGTRRTVDLSLQIPEGFTAGKYPTSGFTLQNKYGMLSFLSKKGFMADTTECLIVLHDSTGQVKPLSKDYPIGFAVNKEKSTAVEGVDFEFVDSSSVYIHGGSYSGSFRIAPLNRTPQKGKEKIVFNVLADEKFDAGLFPELELNLLKAELKVLDGTWQMDTLITDSLYFENIWGSQCSGYSLVPEFSYSDAFEVSFMSASFAPSFPSGFRNYFIGDSNLDFADEIDITDPEGNSKKVQLLSLDNTNRYFSADTTSTDLQSFVGIYLTTDAETETDRLELYILDHTSKSFMPELESGMKYGSEKPVATTPGMYVSATFRKSM